MKVDGWCCIRLEVYMCKKMENKSLGQNTMGINHEGSQGQT